MKTIVFTGGGTAGHVIPNLALIAALKHEYNCVYVGTNGIEKTLCERFGAEFFETDAVKFDRSKPLSALTVPFRLPGCVKRARAVLERIRPSLVFGKGGYAALPAVLAAHCPVLCHESDLTPGLTTRLCAKKAKAVLCAFEPCANRFKNGIYTGAPLKRELFRGERAPQRYGFTGARRIIGIVGGSSGAASLNAAVVQAIPELCSRYDIIHITGKGKATEKKRSGYTPVEFEFDMPGFYATCDGVITRAGANALFECIALNKPALAVPLEKASRGDQVKNAEYFKALGAINLLRERDMTTDTLCSAADGILAEANALRTAMRGIKTDGTAEICKEIRRIVSA